MANSIPSHKLARFYSRDIYCEKLYFILMAFIERFLFAGRRNEVNDRVVRAAIVLKEIAEAPDKGIPKDLLDKCACVAVIPGQKKRRTSFSAPTMEKA